MEEEYQRNQAEWAAARAVAGSDVVGDPSRTKQLLEADHRRKPTSNAFAFYDHKPQSRGGQSRFSRFNVFMLCLGLHLLDIGLKPAEVVAVLQHCRAKIEKSFRALERLGFPVYVDPGAPPTQIYLVVERFDGLGKVKHRFLEPRIFSCDELYEFMAHDLPQNSKACVVVELSHLAADLNNHLADLPELRRRGRPTTKK